MLDEDRPAWMLYPISHNRFTRQQGGFQKGGETHWEYVAGTFRYCAKLNNQLTYINTRIMTALSVSAQTPGPPQTTRHTSRLLCTLRRTVARLACCWILLKPLGHILGLILQPRLQKSLRILGLAIR